jgi:putative endonuclease
MTYFVYILECSDKTLYCGSTNNIEKRILHHNSPNLGAKYTRRRQPVVLKYSEEFASQSDALKREYAIKQLSRPQKLELIKVK